MNRRDFLSFLSVAPVAVPMAAQAITASPEYKLFHGVAGEVVMDPFMVGELRTGRLVPTLHSTLDAVQESERIQSLHRVMAWRDDSVEAQMRADDLFDFGPHLRDTAEPRAPVSPDKENEFPTADQDDTRQSAHVFDTLIPNSACRLSRSWGAV